MRIKSRNQLFEGEEIEKPPKATHIYNAQDEPIYKCPHCGEMLTDDETDVLGAEPDCCFCHRCNGEFEM
jgi:formylmethanofuran dehydrogenase subunit E